MDTTVYDKVPSRTHDKKELVFRRVIDDVISFWPKEEFVRTDARKSQARRQYSSTISKISIRAFSADENRAIIYFARSTAPFDETAYILRYQIKDGLPERFGAIESRR